MLTEQVETSAFNHVIEKNLDSRGRNRHLAAQQPGEPSPMNFL
jgi:hypothetical protein